MQGMRQLARMDADVEAIVAAALAGELTEDQAEQLAGQAPEVVKLVLLAAAERIAELRAKLTGPTRIDPSTPSGQRPPYTRPPAPKRKGKPGAKPGHKGRCRPKPERIDRRQEHRLPCCPDCGGRLQRCKRTRVRTIQNLPDGVRTEVTEHTIHRDYCPRCKNAAWSKST